MSFVHLHVHSEYSLLDGLGHPHQIVARAKELNQPAVALTDHGVMYGAIDFYNAARQIGVKPLIGMEGYLARRSRRDKDPQKDKSPYHLLLLAQNEAGYQNLLQLATLAQLEGFYYKPRLDKESLERFAQGLIVTTGCGSSEIPRLIQNGQVDQARETLAWYVDVFVRDRFFIELQLHEGIPGLVGINRQLLAFGKEFSLQAVATNDVHFVRAENARAQDVLLCIGTGSLMSEPDRMKMTDTSYYLKSAEEMAALFGEVPEALSNTLRVAEMCTVDLDSRGYHLPQFPVPEGYTAETYLRRLCEEGLAQRYGARAADTAIRQRLDYELGVIHQMGFDTYFLIVGDLTRYARERGIWYNVRGSAAGSIVAHTAGITLLDPLQHGLIFERFLNPGRISMPDIDLDFPDDRRAEMIEYAVRTYGRDKVAQIITFGTLGARAAIRDVGRAMDVPLNDVDHIAKLVPAIPGKPITIREAVEQVAELKEAYQSTDYVRDLLDAAVEVEGTARNVGTHAAGVIISDKPLVEYVPLHRPTKGDDTSSLEAITQFEMGVCEAIGLLKVDFLGLSTLTIMRKACDLIEQRHGVQWTLDTIPIDDPAAFELMARGEVSGIFQVEGEGMRRVLTEMKPKKFEHIVATISLFRPGPIEYIPTYIRRLHGDESVEYKHPALEPILAETYGITVYQEQIIEIAKQLAGYSLPEADEMRKAVGKKIKEKIDAHRAKFVKGAVKNGIEQ
ncbi:MAG TPA: DNA polymerase III subunit alpha [Anaerolineae bacterium]|nr:DNA polymerase III subunit alpha [Anaerolineae bacterium]